MSILPFANTLYVRGALLRFEHRVRVGDLGSKKLVVGKRESDIDLLIFSLWEDIFVAVINRGLLCRRY